MAIASLVLSLVGLCTGGLGSILGIIFGFIARNQIRRSGGAEGGSGLAVAGLIIGFVVFGLWLLYWVFIVIIGIAASTSNNNGLGSLGHVGLRLAGLI